MQNTIPIPKRSWTSTKINHTPQNEVTQIRKEAHGETQIAKIKIKVRTPTTWPPTTWFGRQHNPDEQAGDTQTHSAQEYVVNLPKEIHDGVINFYIGDLAPQPGNGERQNAQEKNSKAFRRCRLEITMKPQAHKAQEQAPIPKEINATQAISIQGSVNSVEMSSKGPQSKICKSDGTYTEWDIRNAKIIPVPADGLCMYHCVHAAEDLDWMKNRHISGMSLDKYREKEDVEWAHALRKQVMSYFVGKGIHEAAD